MIAIDTNILVRVATRDNERQAKIAEAVLPGETVWIGHTVLLELEWVLRSQYDFSVAIIHEFLASLIEFESIHVEAPDSIAHALEIYAQTGDFADALHFARRPVGSTILTFDKKFARKSERASGAVNVLPSSKKREARETYTKPFLKA
jgi:predicted nucleic-acid-binding protein